ncbi:HlyD family efflux transporter periplasmic adaptor subunit [Acinetobacter sp. ME22]|uniref:HlyD family secretion protein n=1 Tax=Acinetobacter sp. ME22 TaxID=2904802 RepID=UPI001EDA441A|nr:HlyD family efflux transporter periplasmic adaptor subunit [Acinetobacter sp. ME22]MCG2572622.1 HlyD family efflux transporter periplasmic adaptor subunit [Acinetobacter sp. ME22]
MLKKVLVIVAVAVLIGVAVWMNYKSKNQLPEGFATSNGRLELQRLDVATLYAGRVQQLLVNEGDSVKENAVLAELSSEQSNSQLMAAEAGKDRAKETVVRAAAEVSARQQQQKVAKLDLENTRQLYQQALVSKAELDRRQAAYDAEVAAVHAAQAAQAEATAAVGQAQAQIHSADSTHQDMLIRAPKAGRVEYRIAEVGNVLAAGSKVVTLLDPSDVTMTVFLPTNTVGKLKVGDDARIVLDGLNAVFPAKIKFIADQAQFTPKYVETADEREKLMYKVKLAIPSEIALRYNQLLKGGMTGNGYVRLNSRANWPKQWAIQLPQS